MKDQKEDNPKGKAVLTEVKETIKRSFDEVPEPDGVKTIVIREDHAKKVYERQKLALRGILSTPFLYLQKRVSLIDELASHLIVNREVLKLSLVVHEEDHFKHAIEGQLEFHPDFTKWGINSGHKFAPHILGEFIKMNRYDFESRGVQEQLTVLLKSFVAKVNKELERVENNKGDRRILQAQTVESNLPDTFNIHVPVFKGTKKVKLEIEIYIDPDTMQCSLHSPEVNERTAAERDTAIDAELTRIKEIAPNLLILEE